MNELTEYNALFYIDHGRKDQKMIVHGQYRHNYPFKAKDDISAYIMAIDGAKHIAKALYPNPDNGCTTVKLEKLYNGKPILFKVLESIVQYSPGGEFITGIDKKFIDVKFLKEI